MRAGKQTQTITCITHTHTDTHARDTVRCAPLELLSLYIPALPPLDIFFYSIFVRSMQLYPNSNKNTRRHTQEMPEYLFLHQSKFRFSYTNFVLFFIFRFFFVCYLLFTFFYACVFRSFVRWLSFHFCAARLLRFAPLSLSLSYYFSFTLYKIYLLICQNILPHTEYCCFSRYVLDQQFTDLSHVSVSHKISVKIAIIFNNLRALISKSVGTKQMRLREPHSSSSMNSSSLRLSMAHKVVLANADKRKINALKMPKKYHANASENVNSRYLSVLLHNR